MVDYAADQVETVRIIHHHYVEGGVPFSLFPRRFIWGTHFSESPAPPDPSSEMLDCFLNQ